MAIHNERCKNCKIRILELLSRIFSEVKVNYNLNISSDGSEFKNSLHFENLSKIYKSLQEYRNYDTFIRSSKLPNVDFFIVNPGFILEFDESQHFTKPRKVAIENYSSTIELCFSKKKWIESCKKLNKRDNDPPFRDEQRAWYDTLRDYAPSILNLKPTVRLYARDYNWCELNRNNTEDINKFKNFLFNK